MAKAKKKQPAAASEMSFEQSLSELQQIVEDLETGQLGLDESMQRFEQGISLLRNCYGTLEAAEQKIEILTGTDAEGRPLTEAFDATATIERKQTTAGRRSGPAASESAAADDENGGELDPRKRLF